MNKLRHNDYKNGGALTIFPAQSFESQNEFKNTFVGSGNRTQDLLHQSLALQGVPQIF